MATKNEIFGRIGEKLAEIELLKRNIDFLSMSDNQPNFDLIIDTKQGLKKVQIKTSKLCNGKKFQFFLKNCGGRYDYLILVGVLDPNFRRKVFYIIPEEDLIQENIKKSRITPQTGINIYHKNGLKYNKYKEKWDYFCN